MTFVAFGKFQARLEDELRAAKSDAAASAEAVGAREQGFVALNARLERHFARFRAKKGKRAWQDTWSGLDAATLAARLAQPTGAQRGAARLLDLPAGVPLHAQRSGRPDVLYSPRCRDPGLKNLHRTAR